MKEIEVKVTKYVAEDGTRFDDKESCEKHEAECMLVSDACANRIAMIQAKRKKIDDENEEEEYDFTELFHRFCEVVEMFEEKYNRERNAI